MWLFLAAPRLDVSGGAVSGGAIKIKASNKVAVSDKARITAVSGTGKGGRIDISGGEVAVSGSALITAASGVGQGRAGDALLNMDSSFRWNDVGGGNDDGGGVREWRQEWRPE